MIDESELFKGEPSEAPIFCEEGTAGHPGDPDPIDLGTDADAESVVTLVKVALFRGHPQGQPLSADGLANGMRIVARVGGPIWHAPKRGQRVVVVFPGGNIETPGSGVIVSSLVALQEHGVKGAESILYGNAGQFVRCHEDGSISLYTTDDATPTGRSMYVQLSPARGLEVAMPWGRLTFGPNGFHLLHSSGARIDLGAIGGIPAPLDALTSYAKMQAGMVSIQGSAVSLGTDAGAANAAAVATLVSFATTIAAVVAALAPISGVTPAQQTAVATARTVFTAAAPNLGKVA